MLKIEVKSHSSLKACGKRERGYHPYNPSDKESGIRFKSVTKFRVIGRKFSALLSRIKF